MIIIEPSCPTPPSQSQNLPLNNFFLLRHVDKDALIMTFAPLLPKLPLSHCTPIPVQYRKFPKHHISYMRGREGKRVVLSMPMPYCHPSAQSQITRDFEHYLFRLQTTTIATTKHFEMELAELTLLSKWRQQLERSSEDALIC